MKEPAGFTRLILLLVLASATAQANLFTSETAGHSSLQRITCTDGFIPMIQSIPGQRPWLCATRKILCVGSLSQILLDCGGAESHDIVQLKGRFVMPGFNDAHAHLGGAGRDKLTLALNGATSVDDVLKMVKGAAEKHKPGEWILGSGWDQSRWPDQKYPTRLELDQAAPNNPVYLDHISGHIAVVNSLALKHAEITSETPNPPGGEIDRFADGEPNGLLKENATEMVTQRIPDPSDEDRQKGN